MSTSIYWTIFSNSLPLMIASMFELMIESINMHYATNRQMMTGIGLATILVHCLGGSLLHGLCTGFTSFASRAYGAQNKPKYKQYVVQGLTNIGIGICFFSLLSVFSYRIVIMTGQSQIIATYAYKTMMYHLPGLFCYFIADFFWGYLNSQKVFKLVLYIFLFGFGLHVLLSMTISKSFGFYGIVISTNITFCSMLIITLYAAWQYAPWNLTYDMIDVEDKYFNYFNFVKECLYIALPYTLNLFMYEFMALYLGSFKLNYQTAAHVALTSFDGVLQAPTLGYSIYALTRIGHYTGLNKPQKIKQIIKSTLIISMLSIYSMLFLSVFFRESIAQFYLDQCSFYKYFFIILNFFVLRGCVSSLKINGSLILRALGFGSILVKATIFCYYMVGLCFMIIYCRYFQMKVLGVWMGFFMGQVVIVCIFLYIYFNLDMDRKIEELFQQVKIQQDQLIKTSIQ